MMYVGGETQDPSSETLALIEAIIKDQVTLLLITANDLAARRGSRVFSNNDLIFQVRHDPSRVTRLQTFLRWKSIRKTIRDDDDKGPSELTVAEDVADDSLSGPMTGDAATKKSRLPAALLPWDTRFFFSEQPPGDDNDGDLLAESSEATLEKLRRADEKTKHMTAEGYATYSEYRHASFTWRKAKRFHEWSGLGVIAEHKPSDDSLDILGFLTCEMVQKLTEMALAIQQQEFRSRQSMRCESTPSGDASGPGLFRESNAGRPPIDVRHIRQAFHLTQVRAERRRIKLN
ncbi:transcription initiation factor IID, 18kD subunit-domain-containing protein, partial [Thelonectria olida]